MVLFVGQLLEAEPVSPFARVEADGDDVTLVIDPHLGIGGEIDPLDRFTGWREALAHACRNGWLIQDQIAADELRIRLGPRTLKALGRSAS